MIHIGGKTYELVQEHKNGYNFEAFRDRFSEVLERYDFIVGDWGYSQLRLKGFFKETNKNGSKDSLVTGIHDYLNEYCNFGCAYFILRKVSAKPPADAIAPAAPETQQPSSAGQRQTSPGATVSHHHHSRAERQERHDRHDRQERHERSGRQERHQPTK